LGELAVSGDQIVVDEECVRQVPASGASTVLGWNSIARVEAQDSPGTLVLSGSPQAGTISIRYEMGYFGELLDFIVAHALSRQSLNASQSTFRTRTNTGVLTVLAISALLAVFALLALRNGEWSFGLALLILPGTLCFALVSAPGKLTIAQDSFTIWYFARRDTTPFTTVSGVYLYLGSAAKRSLPTVLVRRSDGSSVELRGYKPGAVALYDALYTAWTRASSPRSDSETLGNLRNMA